MKKGEYVDGGDGIEGEQTGEKGGDSRKEEKGRKSRGLLRGKEGKTVDGGERGKEGKGEEKMVIKGQGRG